MKNSTILTAIVAVIVGAVAFYGGMQYQMRQTPFPRGGEFSNRMMGQNGQGVRGNMQQRPGNMGGMQPTAGEIISVDDTGVTVKLLDGSTKIVVISESTAINKSSAVSKTDLKTGEQITVFGTQNQDGSVTAQNISIGGMLFRGFGGQPQSGTPSPKE